eukprot:m.505815 g.505815  ORF g.505815 m.505815 type:complete len:71 (+) comp21865_c0_seq17:2870-3082(+)
MTYFTCFSGRRNAAVRTWLRIKYPSACDSKGFPADHMFNDPRDVHTFSDGAAAVVVSTSTRDRSHGLCYR